MVKNPSSNGGDTRDAGPVLGLGRSEVELTTHSSILAWKIPWTEEPGGHGVTKVSDPTELLNNNK